MRGGFVVGVADHDEELFAAGLRFGLEDSLLDKVVVELRVGPSRVEEVRSVLCDKALAKCLHEAGTGAKSEDAPSLPVT